MNMRNLWWKENLWVKFKHGICTELCLKLWFEKDWYFCNITETGWFWKRLSGHTVPNNPFQKSVWKNDCPEVQCGTLPRTRFDQIRDHKHDINSHKIRENTCFYWPVYCRIRRSATIRVSKNPFSRIFYIV